MSLVSFRCLFVLVLILGPFPTRSDGTDGFPKLDDKDKLRAAVEKIRKEDVVLDFNRVEHGVSVEAVLDCFAENAMCHAADSIKNEVRLRNGYKLLGEGCSADPALNQHLFSPPSIRDLLKYPIWQRHLLDANQPLCNPFKHLQCSKTTAKCECRPGLIWREKSFKEHNVWQGNGAVSTTFRGLRDREKICIFAMNKPCQMREYPGDEEIDSNALRPEQIKEGIPLAEYFGIFRRGKVFGDLTRGIEALTIQPPACGDNECSRSLYGQRQRVCAPRDWDKNVIFALESTFSLENHGFLIPLDPGYTCEYERHRRLYTISDEELSETDFWAKREKNLDDLGKADHQELCDLMRLSTCSPPKVGEFKQECVCIYPFMGTEFIPAIPHVRPTQFVSCVLREEDNKCDMTNGIIKILRNETWTRGAKLLINKGVENAMVGVCPENFKCHAGLDINDEMEIYCTCSNGQAGPQCLDKLTGFLMFPRVPSFPSDAKDIEEKWKIFNDFNKEAMQFETIFKLSKGESCDLNAEAEGSTAVERIRRLDKKGTVMTKAQYKKLTDTIVKLTKQHQNGQGLCQQFGFRALTCNSVNRTCVTEDEKIMLEACRHLADNCELEGMIILSGKCFCAPKFEPSTTPDPRNNSTTSDKSSKSFGVVKTRPDFFIIIGIIVIAMK